jgi:hypothetical protein
MKTAMQEHIDWLKSTLEICEEHATPLINCLKLCISDAESKLEMEKQQIIDAHNNRDHKSATLYYNETFKNK